MKKKVIVMQHFCIKHASQIIQSIKENVFRALLQPWLSKMHVDRLLFA